MTRRKKRGDGPGPGFTPRTAVLDPVQRDIPMPTIRANVERLEVGSVHYGDGAPTHVSLAMTIEDADGPIVVILKTADEVDKLIMALTRHRIEVFGDFRS